MPKPWIAEAPGKLVLIGEYAVLEGYPAVVAAVDRRARVTLEESPIWLLDAPQLGIRNLAFDPSSSPAFSSLTPRLGLFERALKSHGRALASRPPFRISLDTGELMMGEQGPKLGLGSSASLATAVTAVLKAYCGTAWTPGELLAEVHDLHSRFQEDRGSGIDVAAAVLGGCLRYRMIEARRPDPEPRSIRLPDDLSWKAVWSGTPASTPELILAVRSWSAARPEAFSELVAELGSSSRRGADALEARDTSAFLGSVRDYAMGLERLGVASTAAIVTDAHREIADIVDSAGGAYKPSGAGGGDLGLAFAGSPDILQEAEAHLAMAGYPTVSLALAENGIRIRHE